MIYKLLLPQEWSALQESGTFDGSPADARDGFIHFSDREQVRETAAKHFAGAALLVVAEVDPAKLVASLKREPARDARLFPHLYGPLPLSAVARTWTVRRHAFPEPF